MKVFLDLAEHSAAAPERAGRARSAAAARAHQPDFQHGVLDDGADIEAVALPHPRIGDAPAAVLVLLDAREALIGFQRVAAGGDEIDDVVEIGSRQRRIGRRRQHLLIEFVGEKRLAAGAAEHVLRQHVERAGPQRRGVLRILRDRIDRDRAFQHLEAVGRHQHGARGLVDAVVGAADPLHQPRGALRRADIDDEIDVAPVDAEVERGGADHAAQFAGRHRVLDLAALGDVERAVMQRDGEPIVVHAPEILEQHFGLAAGVDEDQRGLVALDQLVHFAERVARAVAGPRQALPGVEHLDDGRRRTAGDDDVGGFAFAVALRHQEPRQRFRLGHRRRQSDRAHLGRQPPQPRQAERQQIAALGGDQRVQFVEHDALQRREQERRVVGGQQQRQLFGRGQQDVRRIAPLPLPPRHRRVAGAGLDLDRQPHLGDRRFQVARDIDRERLQGRDVEGVQAAAAFDAAAGGDEACVKSATGSAFSPLLPRAKRVAGRGRGWGVLRQSRCQLESENSRRHPPPPTPPRRFAEGGEQKSLAMRERTEHTQLHQRRQKSRQRLAGAGRRDQQRRAVVAGLRQQCQLMLTRRPAARREPLKEAVGQQRGRLGR